VLRDRVRRWKQIEKACGDLPQPPNPWRRPGVLKGHVRLYINISRLGNAGRRHAASKFDAVGFMETDDDTPPFRHWHPEINGEFHGDYSARIEF